MLRAPSAVTLAGVLGLLAGNPAVADARPRVIVFPVAQVSPAGAPHHVEGFVQGIARARSWRAVLESRAGGEWTRWGTARLNRKFEYAVRVTLPEAPGTHRLRIRIQRRGASRASRSWELTLAGPHPPEGLQPPNCGTVDETPAEGSRVVATVRVQEGEVSCEEAREVAMEHFSGRTTYVDNGFSYNSYFQASGGWTGGGRDGGWTFGHEARGVRIGGVFAYVCGGRASRQGCE